MPFDDNAWSTSKLVPAAELLERCRSAGHPLLARTLDGQLSDTAREWAAPGWQGRLGFISSMSDHFCAGCSRLRVGSDGGFKVRSCLHVPI